MKPAEDRLAPELRAIQAQAPRVPIVANVDAEPKREAQAAIEALVQQVSKLPVQMGGRGQAPCVRRRHNVC